MPEVSNPTAGDVHVNRPLTNFAQKFIQNANAFVAQKAFPNIPVSKQSDLYYEFDKEDFLRDDVKERADGAESAGSSFTLSINPYFCRVFALHKDVTDRQRANQDDQVKLDQSATQFVTGQMLIRREKNFVTNLFSTSLWANDQNVDWSAGASTPIQDIRAGIQTVHLATGYRPNKMVISRTGWDTLLDNDEILSRITGGATTNLPAQVQKTLLAQLFEIDEIHVMDSIENTAKKGATPVHAFIGGDNCLVYYAPDSIGLEEPTAGIGVSWTGLMGATPSGSRVKRFRMEANEADRVEAQMAYDYKLTSAELGHMFTSVSAA